MATERGTKIIKNCLVCKKEFVTYPCKEKIGKGKYCSRECSKITLFKKGSAPWHKGLKGVYTPEQLERITIANRVKSWTTASENNWQWKGGKPKCKDCEKQLTYYAKAGSRYRSCKSKFYSKENSPSWKGGISSADRLERIKFRRTTQKLVFEKDNYTCQNCGVRGNYLQVDHIKGWSEFPELRFDISNCQTLCMSCHYFKTFNKILPKGIIWGHNLNRKELS
jgi:hypothetical protein